MIGELSMLYFALCVLESETQVPEVGAMVAQDLRQARMALADEKRWIGE